MIYLLICILYCYGMMGMELISMYVVNNFIYLYTREKESRRKSTVYYSRYMGTWILRKRPVMICTRDVSVMLALQV